MQQVYANESNSIQAVVWRTAPTICYVQSSWSLRREPSGVVSCFHATIPIVDANELENVFLEIRPSLERYIARLVGLNYAEDMVQEAFVRALAGLSGFHGQASTKNWLYRIAANLAIDNMRRRSKSSQEGFPASCDDLDASNAYVDIIDERPWNDVEERLDRSEMGDCIARFVRELQPAFKTIVILREFDHLTYEDIAEITGISQENVRVRLHRARGALRKALEKGCHIWKSRHGGMECLPKDL
jgi:RNA polymerase sigma-70 factor (ECF subfamily)